MTRLPTPGSDSGTWGAILNDYLARVHAPDGTLKTDSVTSDAIAPNAVTASALAPNSVTNTALASNSVNATIIADRSITNALIADGTLQEAKLDAAVLTKLNQVPPVVSVAGKTGTVTLAASDINDSTVTGRSLISATDAAAAKTTLSLTKADVGLSNVDNTSDTTKNNAVATLTNKTISGASNTFSNIPESAVTNLTTDLAAKAPLASPTFTGTVTVPTPTNNTDAATKAYVDSAAASGTPDATASTKGKIQLAGDLGSTAASPTVPGLATKEPTITAGTTLQYWRGDKSWQTLDKTAVGLANVDNTADTSKIVAGLTPSTSNSIGVGSVELGSCIRHYRFSQLSRRRCRRGI